MKKGFDDIFNECLERLFHGESIEQCLACYPEYASELEPLLRTALVTRRAAAVIPSPEFRTRARVEFQRALQEQKPVRAGWLSHFSLQPRWVNVAISVLILLAVVGSGTVAAARNSMPDEPLYRVKLVAESARLTLTRSKLSKAELYAQLADKRVKEIVAMADKGKPEEIDQTARLLTAHLATAAKLTAAEKPAQPETMEAQRGLMAPQPAPVPTPAPAPAPPMLTQAPTPAPAPAASAPAPEMPSVASAPTEQAKNGGITKDNETQKAAGGTSRSEDVSDKRAKLKKELARYAIENPEALRESIKKVPPSVRPALLRALAAADEGYRQVLENLD